jgi:hypothetical protein
VFKEQSSNSKVQSPKSKVQRWNQKRGRNFAPFFDDFGMSKLKVQRLNQKGEIFALLMILVKTLHILIAVGDTISEHLSLLFGLLTLVFDH